MAFLMAYRNKKLISQTNELPNLYASFGVFDPPKQRIEVTSPVGDMLVKMTRQIAKGVAGVTFEAVESGIQNAEYHEFLKGWRDMIDAAVKTEDIKDWIKAKMGETPDIKKKQHVLSIYNMQQKDNDHWIGFRSAYFSDVLLSVFQESEEYKERRHFFERYIHDTHDNN